MSQHTPFASENTESVWVCVATYRRPEQLRMLLQSIQRARLDPRISGILVVDNDPNKSAQATVLEMRTNFKVEIRYFVEDRPGVSAARNRLVSEASRIGAEWIVFVDDDELVSEMWLVELLRAMKEYGADVILGPVDPIYPPSTPAWIRDGDFMGRPHRLTGDTIEVFNTGNVLIRMAVLAGIDVPFDDRFGLTGGEDTMLSLYLAQRNVWMIWCDEAVVCEPVEESRLNLLWILKRAFRGGNSYSRAISLVRPKITTRLMRVASGTVRCTEGMFLLCRTPFSHNRRTHGVNALRKVAVGIGSISGAFGKKIYVEYRRYDAA